MRDIRGKTALVTGGARRIGRATARGLACEGANVVVHYWRSASQAEELVRELARFGVGAWALGADLRAESELGSLIDRATRAAGPLSILVNNASAFPRSTFEAVARSELIASVELDAWAPFELARHFARGREAAQIVNLLDTRIAAQFDWQHFAYCSAKGLLALFTRLLALRLAPRIAVNAVAPGLILPPEGEGREYLEAKASEVPLERVGAPAFVADAVLFLLKSEFVTGQTIFVDGGRHLMEGDRG